MAICQKGVVLNRVEAGRVGGNSVCTSWLKGEASFALGEILRISETAGILQCKLKVTEGTWAITQQQPGSSVLVFGRKLRVRGTRR